MSELTIVGRFAMLAGLLADEFNIGVLPGRAEAARALLTELEAQVGAELTARRSEAETLQEQAAGRVAMLRKLSAARNRALELADRGQRGELSMRGLVPVDELRDALAIPRDGAQP